MSPLNNKLIKRKRKELNMTQGDLALQIGYADKSMVCRLESGQLDDIPLSKAIELSNVLQVEINDLVRGAYKED